jgi:hypothetical protein
LLSLSLPLSLSLSLSQDDLPDLTPEEMEKVKRIRQMKAILIENNRLARDSNAPVLPKKYRVRFFILHTTKNSLFHRIPIVWLLQFVLSSHFTIIYRPERFLNLSLTYNS